ncbi:hypothetical protein [Planctellipticum variicoloris]|uniref:hypothetical protein n=1 Tax=Planctellipticum variicoloris TaxID=3064265 RepID=UPI0030135DB9|nr:hypothetical protein SH412_003958 [Planctomycetaceae bacterium SH412]
MVDLAAEYPWYRIVRDSSLEQGDILRDFEIPDLSRSFGPDGSDYDVELQVLDVVVMTQSCDLEHGKARSVVLCPVVALRDFVAAALSRGEQHWGGRNIPSDLSRGNIPGYHLLNDLVHDDCQLPVSIVDFHEIYAASTPQVKEFAATKVPRLRLCPPYKEHLAQSFARFFMRVGLPSGIAPEKLKNLRP